MRAVVRGYSPRAGATTVQPYRPPVGLSWCRPPPRHPPPVRPAVADVGSARSRSRLSRSSCCCWWSTRRAWTTREALLSAQQELEQGADALRAGDLAQATRNVERASERADSAESFRLHPSAVVGDCCRIGDDVRAITPSPVPPAWSSAGLSLVAAAGEAGWEGGDLSVLEADGQVDLGMLERRSPASTTPPRAWNRPRRAR